MKQKKDLPIPELLKKNLVSYEILPTSMTVKFNVRIEQGKNIALGLIFGN